MWFQERRTVSFQVTFLLKYLQWLLSMQSKAGAPVCTGLDGVRAPPSPRGLSALTPWARSTLLPALLLAVWLPRMPLPNFIWHILQDHTQGHLLCETSPDLPIRINGNILCCQSRRHSPMSWVTCVTVCVYCIASSACVPGHMCTQGAA